MNRNINQTPNSSSFTPTPICGRFQTMTSTKTGCFVIVCRSCRLRDENMKRAQSMQVSAGYGYSGGKQSMTEEEEVPSPEVFCLCQNMEDLKIDAPRRSARLQRRN
mmetsp:Transcript_26794/g.56452  ORF Transcript_26794/g.56452 Transcript_26794/m.56452 type:complete len:106 (-) Transcript_26794:553-870(-)